MAQEQASKQFDEIPQITPPRLPGSANNNLPMDAADHLLNLENGFGKTVTHHLDVVVEDSGVAASLLLKSMQGDSVAIHQVRKHAEATAEALFNPETWQRIAQHMQDTSTEAQAAWTNDDFDKLGQGLGAIVMTVVEKDLVKALVEANRLNAFNALEVLESRHPLRAPESNEIGNTGWSLPATSRPTLVPSGSHLAQETRPDLMLENAFNTAVNGPDQDRQERYAATVTAHPELEPAITGYELIRQHLAHDGKLTQAEQEILQRVAVRTSIQILDGKLADIKVTAEPGVSVQEAKHPAQER